MSEFVSCDIEKLQGSWIELDNGATLGLVDDKRANQKYVCYYPNKAVTPPFAISVDENGKAMLQVPTGKGGAIIVTLEDATDLIKSGHRLFLGQQ